MTEADKVISPLSKLSGEMIAFQYWKSRKSSKEYFINYNREGAVLILLSLGGIYRSAGRHTLLLLPQAKELPWAGAELELLNLTS